MSLQLIGSGGAADSSPSRRRCFLGRKVYQLILLAAIGSPLFASAALTNYVWDGNAPTGNGNNNWSRRVNWSPTNTAPPANAIHGLTNTVITFAGTLELAPVMNGSYFINSLVFADNAGAFNLTSGGANRILTIGAGGIANLSANNQTIASSLSLSNAQTWNASAGDLRIQGTVNLGANALTLAGPKNVAINNVIRGSGGISKQGAGTLTLTAANLYSGGTTINGGTLAVNNATGSGTGSGIVTIGSGGTLLGSGSIGGVVINRGGGTISAGSGVGRLSTGSEFWLSGSTARWEIRDAVATAGVGWDILNIVGTLDVLATSSAKAFIDVTSLTLAGLPGAAGNFDPTQNYTWTIVQTTGGVTFLPGESELTVFQLITGGFANPLPGASFTVGTANGGKDLTVIYTVPEPEKWMFLVMGICGYCYSRKWSR